MTRYRLRPFEAQVLETADETGRLTGATRTLMALAESGYAEAVKGWQEVPVSPLRLTGRVWTVTGYEITEAGRAALASTQYSQSLKNRKT